MSNLIYAGKTYKFSVDNGVVFHNTYSPDGTTLHYETVAGPTTGASEDVTLHAAEAAPGVFLLGWVEKSGMTVTHAMNLNTLTVHTYLSHPPMARPRAPTCGAGPSAHLVHPPHRSL